MSRQALNNFSWEGQPLSSPPDWINGVEYEEVTPLELTTWLVDKFRLTTHNDVGRLLDDTQTVRRLFSPKMVYKNKRWTDAEWEISNPTHAYSIAMYIFCEKKDAGKCSSCMHKASTGPGDECIVDTDGRAEGACTNCYYKGRGKQCSHRVHSEAQKATEERKSKIEEWHAVRQQPLKNVPDDKLEEWLAINMKELVARKFAELFPGFTTEQLGDTTTEKLEEWLAIIDKLLATHSTDVEAPARKKRKQIGYAGHVDRTSETRTRKLQQRLRLLNRAKYARQPS